MLCAVCGGYKYGCVSNIRAHSYSAPTVAIAIAIAMAMAIAIALALAMADRNSTIAEQRCFYTQQHHTERKRAQCVLLMPSVKHTFSCSNFLVNYCWSVFVCTRTNDNTVFFSRCRVSCK